MTTQRYLDSLPPPSLYEEMDFATIRRAMDQLLLGEIASIDLSAGSVATILNDTHGGYAYNLRNYFDARVLQTLLRYATGSNLDHVGAWFGEDGEREGRTDEVYRRYLYAIALSADSTVTEDSLRGELIKAFTDTINDVSLDENYATGVTSVYTLRPYQRTDTLSVLQQSAALRGQYNEFVNSPAIRAIGQRYTVLAENIIPYTLSATITYSVKDILRASLVNLVDRSISEFLERTFQFGEDIRISQVNRALAVHDAIDVNVVALHRNTDAGGVSNLLVSDEAIPNSAVFTSLRAADISQPTENGVTIAFVEF